MLFRSLAEAFGFNRDSFAEALASDDVRAVHDEQRQLAERLQVEGYPTVLLLHNGEAFPIAVRHQGTDDMLEDITDLLAEPNA